MKSRFLVPTCLCAAVALLVFVPLRAGEIVLANEHIEVRIDPEKGRIMHLSEPGGENLLWVNPAPEEHFSGRGWNSWGGDRVLFSPNWMWPQIYGEMIPDPAANDRPWEVVDQGKTFVHLRSELVPELGVRGDRVIRLEAEQPVVRQIYLLEKVGPSQFPVHVWTLAHVPPVGTVWLGVAEDSFYRSPDRLFNFFPWREYREEPVKLWKDSLASVRVPEETLLKMGSFGDWLAWEKDGQLLWIASEWKRRHPYLDRSNLQVFMKPGKDGFIELETTSPAVLLRVGEVLEHETRMGVLEWDHPSEEASANALLQWQAQRAED